MHGIYAHTLMGTRQREFEAKIAILNVKVTSSGLTGY